MLRGHLPDDPPQLGDALAGQRVVDPVAVAAGPDQAHPQQLLQVLRGVRDGLAELASDLVDRTLRLHQQIDDLGTPAIAERPPHTGEPVEQRILRRPVAHVCTSLEESIQEIT